MAEWLTPETKDLEAGDILLEVNLRWTSILVQGGVAILLGASCYGNQDKLRPCGPLPFYS